MVSKKTAYIFEIQQYLLELPTELSLSNLKSMSLREIEHIKNSLHDLSIYLYSIGLNKHLK